jgi:hypothetical protein
LSSTPVLGLSVQSGNENWLDPYGYEKQAFPKNKHEIFKLAKEAARVMRNVNGLPFNSLTAGGYKTASGTSLDWYNGALGTRYAFTADLRGKTFNRSKKYIIEPHLIKDSGKEFLAGMKVVFEKLIQDVKKGWIKPECRKNIWNDKKCKKEDRYGKCRMKHVAKNCKVTCRRESNC